MDENWTKSRKKIVENLEKIDRKYEKKKSSEIIINWEKIWQKKMRNKFKNFIKIYEKMLKDSRK